MYTYTWNGLMPTSTHRLPSMLQVPMASSPEKALRSTRACCLRYFHRELSWRSRKSKGRLAGCLAINQHLGTTKGGSSAKVGDFERRSMGTGEFWHRKGEDGHSLIFGTPSGESWNFPSSKRYGKTGSFSGGLNKTRKDV